MLATGGFGVRLARERGLLLRAAPWSEGDGLAYALARGAATTAGLDEFYGRALPAQVGEDEYVSAVAALRAARARRSTTPVATSGPAAWHENDLVQRVPGGRPGTSSTRGLARADACTARSRELVETARAAGGDVRPAEELPFPLPPSPKLVEPPFIAVRVRAGVTHTLGGLRIDEQARVLDTAGVPVLGLHAAGADAGGIFTGGYGSGLAAALVYGRIAAETALA